MALSRWRCLTLVVFLGWAGLIAAQEQTGRLEGRVIKDGEGVGAVLVLINELRLTTVTEADGAFSFDGIPRGSYTLILTLGNNTLTRTDVFVTEGRTRELELEVDWDLGVREEVTVTAAARAAKIVDAPAAVTSIPEEQIEQQASHGQVPKVLEFTPGAEVTQSGLYDFNFNTRGFNSSLNRRVSTYIDGRDVGVVLLGAQEWAAISGGLDDVASLEFIRGPSAALYGANASSGVINITTKAPRDVLGTFVRLTAGELDTQSLDFRRADELGYGWYAKVTAGFKNSGDFTVSRNPDGPDGIEGTEDDLAAPEYSEFCPDNRLNECLLKEKSLFREQNNDIQYGSVRFDKSLSEESILTFEAGFSDIKGPVFQTGIGRVQGLAARRPFYRVNYSNRHWSVLGHLAKRKGDQVNLSAGLPVDYALTTDTERYGVEVQGNWNFDDDRWRFVVGAAHTEERVDTVCKDAPVTDPLEAFRCIPGEQTVVYEPIETDRQAIFSQLDWRVNEWIKLVFAGRMDKNTLHDTQFSPKAALVYSINPKNSLRFTFNRAFQVANYSEFFLHARLAEFPLLGFAFAICSSPILDDPSTPEKEVVDCGVTEDAPILAVGNDDLQLEKTEAWEVGYSGLLANKVFVTFDYYNSKNEDFITDLVPQVGTILGNLDGCVDLAGNPEQDPQKCPINNDYLPWVSTEEAETTIFFRNLTVAQALRNSVEQSVGGSSLGFRLARDLDGSTVVVGRTYSNVGRVDTQGVDFGIQYFVTPSLNLQASYSWFDFEILEAEELCAFGNEGDQRDCREELDEILLPNSPENKASISLSYAKNRWAASFGARWVEGFRWSAGVFQGNVDCDACNDPRNRLTDVKDYTTVDMGASYAFNDMVRLGVNIANATDHVHHQAFGGDLLSRRALANLTFSW